MYKYAIFLLLGLFLSGCVTTSLISGNSNSVTYGDVIMDADLKKAYEMAEKHCGKFNKKADRFFAEKKQIINDEIQAIKDLNKQLINGDKSISDINNELSKLQHSKNTNEFKKINTDLNKEVVKLKNNKKKEKVEIYSNIYNALLESSATDPIPNIFLESIKTSHANKKSNIKELSYACIKLEILAGLDSLKKDAELRNSIQLELLSSKFNKNNNSIPNDIDSILKHFISNFSCDDEGRTHQNLWKRINKCFEVLL